MKILYLCSCLSRGAGGIFEIERSLAISLRNQFDVDIEVFGLADSHWEEDRSLWRNVTAVAFPVAGPARFGYSPKLREAVMAHDDFQLAHLHDLWQYPSQLVHSWSKRKSRPYVVTPNGMLEPWALQNSRWKKRIAEFLYLRASLQHASCLQANTQKELIDIRAYGLKNPVAVIPNGVDLPEFSSETGGELHVKSRRHRLTMLFLGRIHPKKGLVNTIQAWNDAKNCRGAENWQLVIAGWSQLGHEDQLLRQCASLGLRSIKISISDWLDHRADAARNIVHESPDLGNTIDSAEIIFVGPVFGPEKSKLLNAADAFILPSFSEGLPMSVLEAWAHWLPVLMTPECNLPNGFSSDAAIRIMHDPAQLEAAHGQTIHDGLRILFEMKEADRVSMGERGRRLVELNYSWSKIASQLKDVYGWIIGGGSPPNTAEIQL